MKVSWRIAKHAAPMMLAQVIPLSVTFAIVSVALGLGRREFVAVIGTTATIAGLSMLINVGVGVGMLRDLASTGNDPLRVEAAIATNLRIASAVSFFVTLIAGVTALAISLAMPPASPTRIGIWIAFAIQLPAYIIAPHTSVLSSAFQHFDRETENLIITLTRSAIGLVAGIVVVVVVADPLLAIAVQSAVASAMAFTMLHERSRRLARSRVRLKLFPRPDFSFAPFRDRVINSVDGAVFMALFVFAQLVAATISLEVAAQIAAGVAFCRLVILPLKMIGLTAGRMKLRDGDPGWKFALGTLTATAAFVTPVALGLLIAAAFGISPFANGALSVLIAAQLLIEPISGSMFSYVKVSFGARARTRRTRRGIRRCRSSPADRMPSHRSLGGGHLDLSADRQGLLRWDDVVRVTSRDTRRPYESSRNLSGGLAARWGGIGHSWTGGPLTRAVQEHPRFDARGFAT